MKFYRLHIIFFLLASVLLLTACDKNDGSRLYKTDQITPHSTFNFDDFELSLNNFGNRIVLVDSVVDDSEFQADIDSVMGEFLDEMNSYKKELEGEQDIIRLKNFGNQLRVASFGIYKNGELVESFVDSDCTCDPPDLFPAPGSRYSCPEEYSFIGKCHSENGLKDKIVAYIREKLREPGGNVDLNLQRGPSTVMICGK